MATLVVLTTAIAAAVVVIESVIMFMVLLDVLHPLDEGAQQ
jgi:hypothetical protein